MLHEPDEAAARNLVSRPVRGRDKFRLRGFKLRRGVCKAIRRLIAQPQRRIPAAMGGISPPLGRGLAQDARPRLIEGIPASGWSLRRRERISPRKPSPRSRGPRVPGGEPVRGTDSLADPGCLTTVYVPGSEQVQS